MTDIDRRTVLSTVWAAPVIAVAVAAPAAAASVTPEPPIICGGGVNDNGTYAIYDDRIEVYYDQVPDIYEVNTKTTGLPDKSYGTNFGSAPPRGTLVWVIPISKRPWWVQVHSFNAHRGENC